MTMYNIIAKKRDGLTLSRDELAFVAHGAADGSIPDYQLSALLMAMYLKGLNQHETVDLTLELAASGESVRLEPDIIPQMTGKNPQMAGKIIFADKHSTGGVGDKITLIALPLAAAAGAKIAKFSGSSLGHTGGTIDKLSAIPGFQTSLEFSDFLRFATQSGIAVSSQTPNICPADKRLYALRDVTATVDYMPLIAASVMSKKLASGADTIVLDVKSGSGAFMKTPKAASELAKTMVDIAKGAGKKAVALVTDMSSPLGNAVGNALEVIEAIEILKNKLYNDAAELSVIIAAYMVYLSGLADSIDAAKKTVMQKLQSGQALLKFKEWIINQSGNPDVIENYALLPKCQLQETLFAEQDGFVMQMDTLKIGMAALECGAGRHKKDDKIDLGAGVTVLKKTGDAVKKGEPLATAHFTNKDKEIIMNLLKQAYNIGVNKPVQKPIVLEIIE